MRATYTFCESQKTCYESYEYITPTLTDNYVKSILKIESSIDFNDQEIPNFKDIADFIESFGTIKYTINGEKKTMNTKIKEVKPTKSNKKGVYYFEVYSEIRDASKISLVFSIRNNKYEYVLKK
jgi:arabinogalactan endo-1,4-beta-galactosidase